ncbi:MAG: efflux transporter outer membrane subunit [Rudaea sp.]|uniref:efflux transporter outer membrane subunit n=1 Tax=unclassified Rudaea TaxID=2627037 RepID=UPI0010F66F5F|nr:MULTISPECIES: efflux transporter outer membrane subunit [unclassified Rudaea]MBN8885490.1 efflux transporter outer membrane subunit [Rudaea sp.]
MLKSTLSVFIVSSLVLAGCAVGPDYRRPDAPAPVQYARKDAVPAGDVAAPAAGDAQFWQAFGDAQLSALIDAALTANNDLRGALARYDGANALLREAKFDALPTITASAQGGHQQLSRDQALGGPRSARSYSAGINASWELDLFGRVRREIEAQRAETQASAADLAAMQVAIAGQVASTYAQLRGLQERLRVARDNAANQRETLSLVEARYGAGRDTEFDLARARAQFETTSSRVPALEAQIAIAEHRLAVLSGRAPEALIAELDPPQRLPALPQPIDPGTPGELLRRRPDIAAAEARLHAAAARVGVATADLFPRLSFSGLLGTQAFHHDALFKSGSETASGFLGIDWSFLDVGRVRARIAASRADAAALLTQYQQTVLLALEDTENALILDARTRREDAQLERAAHDSADAARLARVRYQAGVIDLYEVLDAERSLLAAQDAFADSHTRSATATVALYRALAGGWPQRMPVALSAATSAAEASRHD